MCGSRGLTDFTEEVYLRWVCAGFGWLNWCLVELLAVCLFEVLFGLVGWLVGWLVELLPGCGLSLEVEVEAAK